MAFLLALSVGFSFGVFLRSLYPLTWGTIGFFFVLGTLCTFAALRKSRPLYILAAIFFFFVSCGILRTDLADTPIPKPFLDQLNHGVSYEGTVVVDPDVRDANQRVTVQVTEDGSTTKLLAVTSRYVVASVGDRVRVAGLLTRPEPFASEGGRTFRYDVYLEKQGVRVMMEHASLSIISPAPSWSVSAFFARVKHTFITGLDAVLPEPYASLAGGIVVGGKQGLGTDLLAAFTLSGLVQIVVLSGYNVMIVAEAVMAGFSRLRLSKKMSAVAGALAIGVFILIAGAGAATLRAGLMAMIALYARGTGRSYAASRALLLVIFLMLVWNPLLLVFDPGFDLSVAATAGIIWLSPLIENRLTRIRNIFWKNAAATTLAAQLAVLPLLLYETGNLSLVAIPANLLVLLVVPAAMAFSAIAGIAGIIFGSVFPLLAIVIAFPAYVLNAYMIFIAESAATLPFAGFTIPAFPFWVVGLTYAGLIYAASSKRFSTTDQLTFSRKASM